MNKDSVLLINPPQSFKQKSFEDERNWVPPLGLLYLNEYLLTSGCNSAVLDMDSGNFSVQDLFDLIEKRGERRHSHFLFPAKFSHKCVANADFNCN